MTPDPSSFLPPFSFFFFLFFHLSRFFKETGTGNRKNSQDLLYPSSLLLSFLFAFSFCIFCILHFFFHYTAHIPIPSQSHFIISYSLWISQSESIIQSESVSHFAFLFLFNLLVLSPLELFFLLFCLCFYILVF